MSGSNPGEWRDPETGEVDYKEVGYKARSAFAVILAFVVLVGGGWFLFTKAAAAWKEYSTADDYDGTGVAAVVVVIPKGANASKIGEVLVAAGVVKSTKAFNHAAAANPNSKQIQAGKYNLKTQLPAATAVAMLLDVNNLVRNWMTLKDGRTVAQQIPVIAKAASLSEDEVKAAVKDWKNLGLPKWAKNGLEGFLFPETYEIPDGGNAQAVIKVATKHFDDVATSLNLEAESANVKLTPYQVVIAASIIEKEVFKAEDRPKVARVIYNRIAKGTPLQMDSIIAYAVGKTGVLNLTDADLNIDSPYNSRKHKGLPPGPISNPSKASLDAALHPADGDWLYFITVDPSTGETLFTADYNEFLAGKQRYLQWCQASDANHKVCYGK
ncbi:MAG: endolytic transglycosylase MltG [Actinobacteria bacterium HGW-Actinobacteria-2]|nr:MAG: endolytic transglycosylase MltG [Actinobacteria bacterium HGW-Actinobacteria-2]